MGKVILAIIIFAITTIVLVWLGLGWLLFAGIDAAQGAASHLQEGGLKSILESIWCGSKGCCQSTTRAIQ